MLLHHRKCATIPCSWMYSSDSEAFERSVFCRNWYMFMHSSMQFVWITQYLMWEQSATAPPAPILVVNSLFFSFFKYKVYTFWRIYIVNKKQPIIIKGWRAIKKDMATKYVYELNGAFSNTLLKNKCIRNSLFSFF